MVAGKGVAGLGEKLQPIEEVTHRCSPGIMDSVMA
jgi:hypothetical protein